MDQNKIANAVEKLERNLPIRARQTALEPEMRRFHQSILRFYIEHGSAPHRGQIESPEKWEAGVMGLAESGIIVLDQAGEISGAYPFINEARGFRVITEFASVNAMCAFDALAVSAMFELSVRIESRCSVSGRNIIIEQRGSSSKVIEPEETIVAAINWDAADAASCCATTLCTEMIFIVGADSARNWQNHNPGKREIFELPEAFEFISAVFVPMMS